MIAVSRRLLACCLLTGLPACAPVALQAPPPETKLEQQDRLDRERYKARIRSIPGAPQEISGFLRIGRVASQRMGSAGTVKYAGNPRDLDTIIDVVNEYTQIDAGFTPDVYYSDPGLMDLPIIVPQSEPTEAELEALTRYLVGGGFALNPGIDYDIFREGLEKFGGLVWGQDAYMDVLPDDHPLFSAFLPVGNARPSSESEQVVPRVIVINDRIAVMDFAALGQRASRTREGEISIPRDNSEPLSPAAQRLQQQLVEAEQAALTEFVRDVRFERMVLNVISYALTHPESIAQRPNAAQAQ